MQVNVCSQILKNKNKLNTIISNKFDHLQNIAGVAKFDMTREPDTTQHDMKLVGYGLRLNGVVSYSGWHDWPI